MARRAKTWSNESGEVLRALPGLWVAERPFVWNGIDVGGKMAVVRLSDGSLWLHSPVELDEKLRRALEELGPVRHAPRPCFKDRMSFDPGRVAQLRAREVGAAVERGLSRRHALGLSRHDREVP